MGGNVLNYQRGQTLIKNAYDCINRGDYRSAIKYFDDVLEYGEVSAVLHDKGFCLNEIGQFNSAIRCFDRVISLENSEYSDLYISAWYNKARSYIGLNKRDEAIACFDVVLSIDPYHANAKMGKDMLL